MHYIYRTEVPASPIPTHLQVLQCNCSVDTVTFPVTVTQQSPAAVSMDTYQITIAPMQVQVIQMNEICIVEFASCGVHCNTT